MPAALANVTELSAAACPLLAKFSASDAERLVSRFNQALAQVRALENDRLIGPKLLGEKFSNVLSSLVKIRNLMTRDKYVVGFIGITQAGKSTTVNNVLGEEICKVGAMDATSSQPCRIVKSNRRSLDVEFLTPSLAESRRQKLCEAIGLGTPPENREVLQLLAQPEKFPESPERPRLRDDLKYLKEFLQSLEQRKDLLTETPRTQTNLPFEKRYEYTTHMKGAAGAEVLLLREARFHIDNPQLPDDLELCDLPGLDSKRTIDDVVTWEYLPSMHGAFLFVNVGSNLLTEAMLKILSKINQAFQGKVGGRAWVVFNKMDSLAKEAFRTGGADKQDNIFGTIRRFLELTEIPESQVCFASKKIWDAAVSAGGVAESSFSAQTMSQSTASPVPETCPPTLSGVWQELLRDGGVSLIRKLMFQEVAVSLAGQIRAEVDRSLESFSREFTALVAAEQKRAKMNQSDLQAAMKCYYAVLNARVGLTIRMSEYPVLVREVERLRLSLSQLFDSGAGAEVLTHLSQEQLAHQFRAHARVLDQALRGQLAGEVLDKVYEEIGKQLEGLPVVPVGPDQQSCGEAWRVYSLEDRGDDSWLAACPRFSSPELTDWLTQPTADGVAGDVYVDLMHDKIDAAVRQTAQVLRSRLRFRLGQLFEELARLTGEPGAEAV